jgi:hypothetical protein
MLESESCLCEHCIRHIDNFQMILFKNKIVNKVNMRTKEQLLTAVACLLPVTVCTPQIVHEHDDVPLNSIRCKEVQRDIWIMCCAHKLEMGQPILVLRIRHF